MVKSWLKSDKVVSLRPASTQRPFIEIAGPHLPRCRRLEFLDGVTEVALVLQIAVAGPYLTVELATSGTSRREHDPPVGQRLHERHTEVRLHTYGTKDPDPLAAAVPRHLLAPGVRPV